jgi:hypothetical protein
MNIRLIAALSIAPFVMSCSNSTAPFDPATGPVEGRYVMVSMDGGPLPHTWTENGLTTTIVADSLNIRSPLTWDEPRHVVLVENGFTSTTTQARSGGVTRAGAVVQLWGNQGSVAYNATLTVSGLDATYVSHTYRFERR